MNVYIIKTQGGLVKVYMHHINTKSEEILATFHGFRARINAGLFVAMLEARDLKQHPNPLELNHA